MLALDLFLGLKANKTDKKQKLNFQLLLFVFGLQIKITMKSTTGPLMNGQTFSVHTL
jgi:hypothetical protein